MDVCASTNRVSAISAEVSAYSSISCRNGLFSRNAFACVSIFKVEIAGCISSGSTGTNTENFCK